MDRISLGSRIKEERIKLHLTQEKLAEITNLSPAYIGFIERGTRSITLEKLLDISNALHVSPDYLLSESISIKSDDYNISINKLLSSLTVNEKLLIYNILKLIIDGRNAK